jgi:hypothetical protein
MTEKAAAVAKSGTGNPHPAGASKKDSAFMTDGCRPIMASRTEQSDGSLGENRRAASLDNLAERNDFFSDGLDGRHRLRHSQGLDLQHSTRGHKNCGG